MVSMYIKGDIKKANKLLSSLKLFTLAESLGGVASLIESPALIVAPVPITPITESLPFVPVIVSIPVVSELFCTQNDVNTHLFYLYFDIRPDIDSITTIDHQ